MSKPMSFQELVNVVKHIAEHNSPLAMPRDSKPCVKYAHPSLDFRFNNVFSITLRGFAGGEVVLYCQNEMRELPTSLYDRVMNYLNGVPIDDPTVMAIKVDRNGQESAS